MSLVVPPLPEGLCGAHGPVFINDADKTRTPATGQCVFLETHEGSHSWEPQ